MALSQLVKRELRVFLKSPGYIATLIILAVFYSILGNLIGETIKIGAEASEAGICVVFEENSSVITTLANLLNKSFNGKVYTCSSLQEAISRCSIGVAISRGFTENVTSPQRGISLKGFVKLSSFSMSSGNSMRDRLLSFSQALERLLPIAIGMEHNIGLDSSKSIHINTSVILFNNVVSEYEYYVIASVATTLPFFISIILAINAISATATVTMEKTEKAFEMLLAQPVKRRDIVLAKIIGSSISSIVYGVLTLLNMFISILVPVLQTSSQLAIQLQNASIASTIFSSIIYALIPASIVLGLIMTGSIGIIIGSITSDENTAGGLSTIILFIFLGAGFAAAFIGLPPTAFTAILAGSTVALLPYAYALFLLSGNGTLVALSIATSIAVCIALIYTAITIFNRDVIIAGLEVSIRRKER